MRTSGNVSAARGPCDIHVATSNAVVTLSGKVASAAERDRALQLARETDGVKSVTDQLQVATK
jgi:osmotically-inducible protein OsmY